MARLIIPDDFAGQQTLFKAILTQHKSLKTKSPLLPFAKQQKMDLAKLEAIIAPAAEQNTASGSLRRDSEKDTQQRDLLLKTPREHLLGEVQYLKHFFAGSERALGEWGITVDAQSRIVYPADVVLLAELIQTFLTHHLSFDPGDSPLQLYIDEHEINVEDDLAAAGNVITINTERNTTTGDSELATQQRDKIWEPVAKAIHLIGAFLMNLYHSESRKMATWGFKVVEDAAGETLQVTKIDPSTSKNITGIKIPSVLTNIGTVAVEITKGKDDKAVTTTILPGKQLGMTKGYSKITVTNPSTLEIAKVQVTVSK